MDRSANEDPGWERVGAHVYRFEAPDTFCTRMMGDVSGDELVHMLEQLGALSGRRGDVFWLSDVSQMGALPPEARAAGLSSRNGAKLRGTAIVGASFQHRVLATLGLKLAVLVRRRNELPPMCFFETEREARAWIDARRQEIAARQ